MTPKEIQELRDKRARLVEQCRAIATKAQTEKRALTSEEQTNYDKIFAEQRTLAEQIKREEELLEAERQSLHGEGEQQHQQRTNEQQSGKPNDLEIRWGARASAEYRSAFANFLTLGRHGLTSNEQRDLSAGVTTQGGFLLAPQQFVQALLKAVDDLVFIRRLGTTFPIIGSASMGAPSLDADPADADWTAEVPSSAPSADTTMAFGKRELTPHPLSKRIKVSQKLLRSSLMPIEQIVIQRLAYKIAITQEKAFLTGSGSNQPLGLFTASSNGISTSRDVSTDNTSTAMTFKGLINAKYGVKAGYRANAQWLFHRDAVKQIASLTDDNGQFIWQPSKAMGEPDMLMGHAINESEYAPNTFTTGLYTGIFGDFSYYWIADSMDLMIQVLNELYAETNQVGYIARQETDGMPALGEAFSRIKLA